MAGGLPRAFYLPVVLLLLYSAVKHSASGICISMILSALFYPLSFLFNCIFVGLYFFWAKFLQRKKIAVIILIGFITAVSLAAFEKKPGKLIPLEEAKKMEEFYKEGRIPVLPMKNPFKEISGYFFSPLFNVSWSKNYEIGYQEKNTNIYGIATSLFLFLFCVICGMRTLKERKYFFVPLFFSSVVLYLLARIFFFKMYYPYRYLYPLPFVCVFIVGAGYSHFLKKFSHKRILFSIILLLGFILLTGTRIVPYNGFMHFTGEWKKLFIALENTPENSIIAGNIYILDNIPLFSKRSVFISDEMSIPFFTDTYKDRKKRLIENAKLMYSPTKKKFLELCKKNNIDYVLVYKPDLVRSYATKGIFYPYKPLKDIAIKAAENAKQYYLANISEYTVFFESKSFFVVDVKKIER